MYIEFKKDCEPTEVDLSSLDIGDCFVIRTGDVISDKLYMKLDNGIVQNYKCNSIQQIAKNAIALDTGDLCFLNSNEKVIPIYYPEVKIVVEKYW